MCGLDAFWGDEATDSVSDCTLLARARMESVSTVDRIVTTTDLLVVPLIFFRELCVCGHDGEIYEAFHQRPSTGAVVVPVG